MGVTPEMLAPVKAKTPSTIPPGLKVASFTDPNSTTKAPATPALGIGGFTVFPMSYDDNRMSFGMVTYDPHGDVITVDEVKGARYIYKVTVDKQTGVATFWGQSDQKVTLSPDKMFDYMTRDRPVVSSHKHK